MSETEKIIVNDSPQPGNSGKSHTAVIIITLLCITFVTALFLILRSCEKMEAAPFDKISKVLNNLNENRNFNVAIGTTIKEENQIKLQYCQRKSLLYFSLARWRGKDTKEYKLAQPGALTEQQLKEKHNILLGQYTIIEAHAPYQFTFLIDMEDQSKWEYKWDKKRRIFTIIAPEFKYPNIDCNEPGITQDAGIEYTVKVDCISFDEDETRKILDSKIPELKHKAALQQLQYTRENARAMIKKHFEALLCKLAKVKKCDIDIMVKFKDELDRKQQKKRAL